MFFFSLHVNPPVIALYFKLYVYLKILIVAGILEVMKWRRGSTLSLRIYHLSGMI
jgi:hypothetical protein